MIAPDSHPARASLRQVLATPKDRHGKHLAYTRDMLGLTPCPAQARFSTFLTLRWGNPVAQLRLDRYVVLHLSR